jgi:hypothetical protein
VHMTGETRLTPIGHCAEPITGRLNHGTENEAKRAGECRNDETE